MDDDTSVRVAVRIRPQIPRELIDMCRICTSVTSGEPQVWLGSDKAFTFDYVFDIPTAQHQIYETCVQQLIEGCFEGYNATVLAYGQTGSGKTYTMGTGFDVSMGDEEELGIIPRAVEHLFEGIEERRQQAYNNNEPLPDFKIHCQFLELYNEDIIDLFDTARDTFSKGKRSSIRIHEDSNGGIYTVGITTRIVTSKQETLQCLKIGALSRTTASTQMNVQSSRSHAIFTLHIKQQRVAKIKDPDMEVDTTDAMNDFETLTAKFHFVDLAGSERLKRTGATGDRAKEGISINCGLLALGNVISALGDVTKKGSHVPYRDSKLTRLLQDSLGGNSRTVMIACISPSDSDFMETLNTLKYANRARNIKNKVVANQDKTSKTIASLRMEIQHLQLELMEYKQGKRVVVDGEEGINDMYHENTMLQTENNNLRVRIKAMQETIDVLTVKNTELLADKAAGNWIASGGDNSDVSKLIQGYIKEIEDLRNKLLESEHVCQTIRRSLSRTQTRLSMSPLHNQAVAFSGQYDIGCDAETENVNELLEEAKQDLERMKDAERRTKRRVGDKAEELSDSDRDEPQDGEMEGSEEADDDEEEEEEEETSESDVEVISQQYRSDLAELTNEISIKQKLIDQLEKSQKRLETLRHSYEEKLIQLQNKIRATQEERDKVLANLGSIENLSEERARKIKAEYERKLHDLTSEMKKIQFAKKEHAALLKNQSQYEKQVRTLRTELADMKKAKVRLMNNIKEEANRHKETEQKRNREIAQLKKESRVRENQIRTLEAEKRMKETVLRRKQEEVAALRRLAKPMSDKVAGRVPGRKNQLKLNLKQKLPFSPKAAKSKWQNLEKQITMQVLKKKTISNWDVEMERQLKQREKLSHKLEKSLSRRLMAAAEGKEELTLRDMDDQIETLKANIDYVQEEITNCQKNIVEAENTKEGQENLDVNSFIQNMTFEETKYLVQKLVNMTVSQSLLATQQEASLKEMEAKMVKVMQNNSIHEELLEHMLKQQDMDMYQYLYFNGDGGPSGESAPSSRSISPVDGTFMVESGLAPSSNTDSLKQNKKARRRTAANPEELLFGATSGDVRAQSTPILDIQEVATNDDEALMSTSTTSISSTQTYVKSDSRPTTGSLGKISPRFQHRAAGLYASSTHSNIMQHSNNEPLSEPISPTSPTVVRKGNAGREENVFSRLTSSSTSSESSQPNRGTVEGYIGKPMPKVSPLICTHVAKGHGKAVLSVVATDTLLFTASKDRTAKVWDLQRGEEILTLDRHPNNVVVVRYCERTRQVFTGSSSSIKVWDLRGSTSKCIKTLQSSGLAISGSQLSDIPSRVLKVPPGEHQINDFALDTLGTSLYCAAGNFVRVWDLRKFSSVGKLSGGHQAAVMCLMVSEKENGSNLVVSGSKDHTIKIFDVPALMGGVHPARKTLEPPHYDGIQSLARAGKYFFSGSRDTCIKKWDLRNFELKQAINQAHRDWVCGLCVPNGSHSILSCCRAGYVHQWSIDSCAALGSVRAHDKPIHAITNNGTCIFTASDDHTVRIWKMRSSDSMVDTGDN